MTAAERATFELCVALLGNADPEVVEAARVEFRIWYARGLPPRRRAEENPETP